VRYGPAVVRLLFSAILFIALSEVRADFIELKNGTRIEGTITSVAPDQIRMEVQTTPTIRDEKSYPRSEIARYQQATMDDMAFAEIADLQVPATAERVEIYDVLLQQKIQPFMKNYGYSKHMPAARKLSQQLEAERQRVAGGEVKIEGEWISAADYAANRPAISARLQMANLKSAPDPASALIAFEVFEKQHASTPAYPAAVRLARTQIEALRLAIMKTKTEMERRKREQAEGLQLASEDRRLLIQRGIDQERTVLTAQVAKARQAGTKWLPLLPDEQVLADLSKTADSEGLRLQQLDVDKLDAAVAVIDQARKEMDLGQLDQAKASLARAEQLWPQSSQLAPLRESLKKAQTQAAATPAPAKP
jgi:hypothetical protein